VAKLNWKFKTNQIQMIAHKWTTKRLEQLILFLNLQQKRGNLILECQRQQFYFLLNRVSLFSFYYCKFVTHIIKSSLTSLIEI
jgi:hypothetical protein